MNNTKRLISILMAISIAVSVLMVGSVSASAATTATAIKEVSLHTKAELLIWTV